MKKVLTTICLVVIVICSTILMNGCAFGITATGGTGQTGTQAANNMFTNRGAGDHSTGNGSGFNKGDSLPGVFRSLRKK